MHYYIFYRSHFGSRNICRLLSHHIAIQSTMEKAPPLSHNSIAIQDKLLWSLVHSKIQEKKPLFEKICDYAYPSITINRDEAYIKFSRYICPCVFTSITLKKFCIDIITKYRYFDIFNMAGTYLEVLDIIQPGINLAAGYFNTFNRTCGSLTIFSRGSNSNVLIDNKIKFRTIIDTIAGKNWDRIGILYYEIKDIERELKYINSWLRLGLNNYEIYNRRISYQVIMWPGEKNKNESILSNKRVELNELIIEKMYLY